MAPSGIVMESGIDSLHGTALLLLLAALLLGILLGSLSTRLWARREIRRAARFGDRRLQSAEWAVAEYRQQLVAAQEHLRLLGGEGAEPVERARTQPGNGNGSGNGHHDDLTAIRGIGTVLARLLENMQITTYRQIAAWGEEEIDAMASHLRVFPDRIRRDSWVQGARLAHLEKYGSEP